MKKRKIHDTEVESKKRKIEDETEVEDSEAKCMIYFRELYHVVIFIGPVSALDTHIVNISEDGWSKYGEDSLERPIGKTLRYWIGLCDDNYFMGSWLAKYLRSHSFDTGLCSWSWLNDSHLYKHSIFNLDPNGTKIMKQENIQEFFDIRTVDNLSQLNYLNGRLMFTLLRKKTKSGDDINDDDKFMLNFRGYGPEYYPIFVGPLSFLDEHIVDISEKKWKKKFTDMEFPSKKTLRYWIELCYNNDDIGSLLEDYLEDQLYGNSIRRGRAKETKISVFFDIDLR